MRGALSVANRLTDPTQKVTNMLKTKMILKNISMRFSNALMTPKSFVAGLVS